MDKLDNLLDGLTEEELLMLRDRITDKYYKPKKPPVRLEIPYKFPSLNEYTNACRKNAFAGANMKKTVQRDIGYFINTLPSFKSPVTIDFTWIEGNRRRDPDNISFAKKFILDSLVECGKLKDDNRKVVTAFKDKIYWTTENEWKVILEIYEV